MTDLKKVALKVPRRGIFQYRLTGESPLLRRIGEKDRQAISPRFYYGTATLTFNREECIDCVVYGV